MALLNGRFKKTTSARSRLLPVLAVVLLLGMLAAACSGNGNADSTFPTTVFWRWIITDVFGFIRNYGARVLVLTVFLKLLLSPLDFYTRKRNKDNARILEFLKPQMDKLNEQYADAPRDLQMKKQALQKSYGYSIGATCLPMIVSLVVFMSLFGGFTAIAKEMDRDSFKDLQETYYTPYIEASDAGVLYVKNADGKVVTLHNEIVIDGDLFDEYHSFWLNDYIADHDKNEKSFKKKSTDDKNAAAEAAFRLMYGSDTDLPPATDLGAPQWKALVVYIAQRDVKNAYFGTDGFSGTFTNSLGKETAYNENFLWVKNVWRPDTWKHPIPTDVEFEGANTNTYSVVMKQVVSQYGYGAWNGWLLLIVLAAGLSFLNQFISTRQQGKGAQAAQTTGQPGSGMNMKMMMYMMPLIIVFFSFSYSSAFNIYMVTSSAMTIVINLASTGLLYLMYKNRGDANPKQRPPKSPRTRNAKARPVQPQHSRGYRKP